MRVDYDIAMEVASHEAIIRQTYYDSVGVATWSVGLTSATGHNVERYVGKPQTLQHCLNVYVWALRNYAGQVKEAFAGHSLTKAQFAAAVSFHWNTGAIKRASWVRHWKAGNIAAARKAFMNWVTPPEITERRRKERDLFFDGKWSNDGTMTEFTRLTARSTPVWGSAKRINVERELHAAFGQVEPVVVDHAPQPDAKVNVPTLSPEGIKEAQTPDNRPATYTVRSGDTLSKIAARHGLLWPDLAEENGIGPPWVIRPGQVLRIPAAGKPEKRVPQAVEERAQSQDGVTPSHVDKATKTGGLFSHVILFLQRIFGRSHE